MIQRTWRSEHMRTQWQSGHLQAKERDLRRNQTCWYLDLGLSLWSSLLKVTLWWENEFLLFKPVKFCCDSLSKPIYSLWINLTWGPLPGPGDGSIHLGIGLCSLFLFLQFIQLLHWPIPSWPSQAPWQWWAGESGELSHLNKNVAGLLCPGCCFFLKSSQFVKTKTKT